MVGERGEGTGGCLPCAPSVRKGLGLSCRLHAYGREVRRWEKGAGRGHCLPASVCGGRVRQHGLNTGDRGTSPLHPRPHLRESEAERGWVVSLAG
jgi:hypothetical protein